MHTTLLLSSLKYHGGSGSIVPGGGKQKKNENLDWIFASPVVAEFSTLNVILNELEIKVVKIYRFLFQGKFLNHISMIEAEIFRS